MRQWLNDICSSLLDNQHFTAAPLKVPFLFIAAILVTLALSNGNALAGKLFQSPQSPASEPAPAQPGNQAAPEQPAIQPIPAEAEPQNAPEQDAAQPASSQPAPAPIPRQPRRQDEG